MVIPSLLAAGDGPPPLWRHFVQQAAAAAPAAPAELVLVGHSSAGPLLPQIAASLRPRVVGYLFVDAGLPHPTEPTPVAPPEFLARLRAMAAGHRLPPWSEWWGKETMRSLLPEDAQRARVTAELPYLPLVYFEEAVPAAAWWPDAPCGYVWFSEAYASPAAETRARGWSVVHLPGHHLHLLTDPGAVADALVELLEHG